MKTQYYLTHTPSSAVLKGSPIFFTWGAPCPTAWGHLKARGVLGREQVCGCSSSRRTSVTKGTSVPLLFQDSWHSFLKAPRFSQALRCLWQPWSLPFLHNLQSERGTRLALKRPEHKEPLLSSFGRSQEDKGQAAQGACTVPTAMLPTPNGPLVRAAGGPLEYWGLYVQFTSRAKH